jgi:hypothetical protein
LKIDPAERVEIGGGTRGGGAVPVRRAARNGETVAVVVEDAIAEEVDVLEAAGTEVAAAAGRAAAADSVEAAEDIGSIRADTM